MCRRRFLYISILVLVIILLCSGCATPDNTTDEADKKPEYESVPAAEPEAEPEPEPEPEPVVTEAVPEPELPEAPEPAELIADAEPQGTELEYLNLQENTPVPIAPVPIARVSVAPLPAAPETEAPASTVPVRETPAPAPEEPMEVTPPAEPVKSFLSIIFDREDEAESPEAPEKKDEPAAPVKPEVKAAEAEPPAAEARPVQTAQPGTDPHPDAVIRIDAPEMEIFTVTLDMEGWLLGEMALSTDGLDTADTVSAEGELRFIGREYYDGKTIFSFYPYETASFILTFRRTDYSAGTVETRTAVVSVLPINEYTADTEESLEGEAAFEAQPDKAQPHEAVPAEDESAVEEVFVYDDAAELLSYIDSLNAAGRCDDAVELLEEGLESLPWTEHDHLYFALANLYEKCPETRDERVAVRYYRQIVDYYPVSIYWQRAKERITYLERYFIHIR